MRVNAVYDNHFTATIISEGTIGYGYHIYNPNQYFPNDSLSIDDLNLSSSISTLQPDVIAISFADTATIIEEAKALWGHHSRIYAKIESPFSIKNITDIIAAADGIIIGRDDLSAYYSRESIANIIASTLTLCKKANKPLIGASNYFQSVYEGHPFSAKDIIDYMALLRAGAAGIYINETNKDPNWSKYAGVINSIDSMQNDKVLKHD